MHQNPFKNRARTTAIAREGFSRPLAVSDEAMAYLKQVYTMLAASLFFAVAAGYVAMGVPFFYESHFLMFFLFLGSLFLVHVRPGAPTLFLFAGIGGAMTGPVVALYIGLGMSALVGQAALMTGVAFGGLTFYSLTTRKDLSWMGGMLFAGLIVLIVGSLINHFFMQSTAMGFAMAGMGAMIFSGLILWETQTLKAHPWMVPPASAAASLFLDILNLFLVLLQLLGIMNSDD